MFTERPASKVSISLRSLVSGVGINDADYIVQPSINGVIYMCPYYRIWKCILLRCYANNKNLNPTYSGCSVCDNWLVFTNFKKWMKSHDWKGKEIDKDILIQGNKIYSPETCLFVTRAVNALTNSKKGRKGKLKQGVVIRGNRFHAQCNANGVQVHIGSFNTESEAFTAYKEFKYNHIKEIAEKQSEPLRSALLKYKIDGDSK
tara:strand:+ start:60 stop:668 length:609 start_codon:yes stop_codon:yes gene_type:complete